MKFTHLFAHPQPSHRRRRWYPTPVLLPGKSHGRRSPVGCSPWSRWGSDTTEQLPFHFSLSCVGEGNGNPLQCSCLENPRVGGAWWAAVYGVAQSQTRLKRLSSSSLLTSITHTHTHTQPYCISLKFLSDHMPILNVLRWLPLSSDYSLKSPTWICTALGPCVHLHVLSSDSSAVHSLTRWVPHLHALVLLLL